MWPFNRKEPVIEQRGAFPSVTAQYLSGRRDTLLSDGSAALSASVATCVGMWSRGFAMLDPSGNIGVSGPLGADVLAAIGADLCLRGESCWHIRINGDIELHRVAYWDQFENGRWHLHIPRVSSTETVKALSGEVLHLKINSAPETPWKGRSPFVLMGGSPALMAEIEGAISGALEWTGRGLLPFPDTVPEEQQKAALSGLKGGGRLAVIRSKADFASNAGMAGRPQEHKRVELTPDLQKADLNPATDGLHERLLAACGIPPALVTSSGNAGAMREAYRLFVLQTIEPLARQLLPELTKVGVSKLGTSEMMSADVAGRARAVGTLVQAGVPVARAMKLAGWSDE